MIFLRKRIFFLLPLFLCILFPSFSFAQNANNLKKIGDICSDNEQCQTKNCQQSDDGHEYCTCSQGLLEMNQIGALQCFSRYGQLENGKTWRCENGTDATNNLNYCTDGFDTIETPLPLRDVGVGDYIFNKELGINEIKKIAVKPETKITIPGLQFSEPKIIEENGTSYLTIPYLSEYISAFFRYGVLTIGILAVLMIIFAGFRWVTSGGNADSIGSAKKMIGNALIGLLIAVGSYTILFSLNPRLVGLQNLKVEYIKTINLDKPRGNERVQDDYTSIPSYAANATPIQTQPGLMSYGFNNVPYFAQGSGEWANLPYGGDTCTTYKQAGCGPTSIAMVLRFYGKEVDPRHPGAIATQTGARVCRGGTSTTKEFLAALEKEYNVKIDVITKKTEALKLLREGKPLVQGGEHAGFTNQHKIKTYDGHFIVLTGTDVVDNQEIIRVNDSGRSSPANGIVYQTIPLFEKSVDRFIYIHPN